ncbi:MAG: glycosyltransferase family 1 protein [Bacteroidota bacterium]|nr:glycosyltransferase family 1 protein [Bacteroidota bacterium]
MKIGIEAQRIFRKKKHGMDMVALELIRHLQQIESDDEFVVFVKPDEDSACLQESKNVKIVNVKPASYPVWEQILLPAAAKKEGIDLLHCTSNTAPLFMSMPLVLTLHDIIYLEKLNFKEGTTYQKFGNLYRRWNVPAIVGKAKAIITVSEFERQKILAHFKMPESNVHTIYNGVGNHFCKITDKNLLVQAKEKFQLPDKYIFYLGNTDPKKNVSGVIKALSILKAKGILPCKLLMLDIDREFLTHIAGQIGDPSILNEIVFTGYVSNKDLPAIYSQASMFLYPSLRESFGIPMIEAMRCEVPIITSNTSCMPEIAGDAALFVNPFNAGEIADAIVRLYHDTGLQNSLVAKGKIRAEIFSWDKNAMQTIDLYRQVVNSAKS